jgi:hypothetical protein
VARRRARSRIVTSGVQSEEAGLRVHVGDSELMTLLLEYFEQQADCVAVRISDSEIEVSLVQSLRSDAHDAAVHELVSGFRRQHPEVRELRTSPNGAPHSV